MPRGLRHIEDLAEFGLAERFAWVVNRWSWCRGVRKSGDDAPIDVQPGQLVHLGCFSDDFFGLDHEALPIHFSIGDIPGHAQQNLLLLQQTQAHVLLGVFGIPANGFLVAVQFFKSQVEK